MYTRELYFQMIPIMTMHPNTIPTAFIQLSLTVETVSEKGANFLPVPIAPNVNAIKKQIPITAINFKMISCIFLISPPILSEFNFKCLLSSRGESAAGAV